MGVKMNSNGLVIKNENAADFGGKTLDHYAQNLETKLKFCKLLIESATIPAHFKSAGAVLAVILRGQEFGFTPIRSLELIDFINGRATLRAAALQAIAMQAGGVFEVLEESARACTIKARRPDKKWEQVFTFTMEQAAVMGLAGKDNWKRMPQFMLYARCVSVLCRRGWPDVIGGLYSREELEDGPAALVVPAEAIEGETPTVEEGIEPPKTEAPIYFYDLNSVPVESRKEAQTYIKGNGGEETANEGIWKAPTMLKKLLPYQIEVSA